MRGKNVYKFVTKCNLAKKAQFLLRQRGSITVRNMDIGGEQVFGDIIEANYHSLVMTGLDAGTNYQVDMLVTNPEGSQTSKTLSFITISEDDLL